MQGKWFKQLHSVSKQFSDQYTEIANRIQSYDQIHDGVLKDFKTNLKINKDTFGVIHGDINVSNY